MDLVPAAERSFGSGSAISRLYSSHAAIDLADSAMVFAAATAGETRLAADEPVVPGSHHRSAQNLYKPQCAENRTVDVPCCYSSSRQFCFWPDARSCTAVVNAFRVVVFQGLTFLVWISSGDCRSPQDLSCLIPDLFCVQKAVARCNRPHRGAFGYRVGLTLSFRPGRLPVLCPGGSATRP